MKKIYTLTLLSLFLCVKGFSQTVVLQNDFNTYAGTTASVQQGWYYSWNVASTTAGSYYTSASFSGAAPNAYKFGITNDTIITPAFSPSDTVSFWCKGSTTINDTNALSIYESADSSSWTLLVSQDTLPTSGTTFKFGLSSSTKYLKFIYTKISGNLAFDDVLITSNATGIADNEVGNNVDVIIYPNPSDGKFKISNLKSQVSTLEIYSMTGEKVYSWNSFPEKKEVSVPLPSGLGKGIYFYKLISSHEIISAGKLVVQ